MDTDTDILKTLQSIEKLLKGASGTVGTGRIPVTSAERAKKASERQEERSASRLYKATTNNLKDMNDTVIGLDKSLVGLNTEVGKTTVSFSSLTASMTKFMATLTPIQQPPAAAGGAPIGVDPLGPGGIIAQHLYSMFTQLQLVNSELDSISRDSKALVNQGSLYQKHFFELAKWLIHIESNTRSIGTAMGAQLPQITVTAPTAPVAQPGQAPNPAAAGVQQTVQTIQPLQRAVPPLVQVLHNLVAEFGRTDTRLETFQSLMGHLSAMTKKLADDFFVLSHVGLGSTQNLFNLSKYAFQSGMSLKAYANIVSENATAASRAGSLDNFNKLISAADGQLAEMGIFGENARELQASLAQSNTLMGVSQNKLSGAISEQISLFDKLHKSTNMSAKEFAQLVKSVSDNEQVQSELVGLGAQDRASRRQDMLSLQSFGQTIGMTAEASRRLGEAMIAARGQTVKSRVEESGRIRQMAQFLGMGAQGERAAQLSVKGRNRTKEEDLEFRQIAANMETAAQRAYQNGSIGAQAVLDQMQESIGSSGFGKNMKESKQATLAQDAGAVNNRDFGEHVGKFGQFVGELLKYVKGFNESIGPSILGAVTAGTLLLFKGPIVKALGAGLSKLPGFRALTGGTTAAVGAGGAAAGGGIGASVMKGYRAVMSADLLTPIKNLLPMLKNFGTSIASLGPTVMGGVKWLAQIPTFIRQSLNALQLTNAISGPLGTLKILFQSFGSTMLSGARTAGSAIMGGGQAIWSGLKIFTGSFGVWAGAFAAAIEMFTGEVSTALNPEGGFFNRIGGMITAFFSAIPNMIIDVINYVFSEDIGKRMQMGFDTFVAATNGAVKSAFSGIFSGVSDMLGWMLPDDSKLVKDLKKWSYDIQDSADSNFKAMDDLWEGRADSLKDLSAKNEKAAKDSEKKAETATTKAIAAQAKYDNVQYGMNVTRESMVQDAKAVIGQPQVQTPPTVNPGTVNTPEEPKKVSEAAQQAVAGVGSPEIVTALNAMIALLRESLTNEQRQVALTEQLLKSNRPTATFTPAEVYADRLLKQGQV